MSNTAMGTAATGTAAANGQKLIDWASRHMPLLQEAVSGLAQSAPVSGLRIGVALQPDAKTACFAQTLQRAGLTVSVYTPAGSGAQDVIVALRAGGISVTQDLQAFLQDEPHILLDDGAQLILQAQSAGIALHGATETSVTGMQTLREAQQSQNQPLPFNIVDLNTSSLKRLVENQFGVGQASVMAFVDITNLQLAGRPTLVSGYDDMGQGVAQHARALGARVTVAESDPLKAMAAVHQGHRIAAVDDEIARSEVVFCTAGTDVLLTEQHIELIPDGALLCVAGGTQQRALNYLAATAEVQTVRADVQQYTLPDGRAIKVIAEGKVLQQHAGEGSPIETMDICLALQVLAIQQLLAADTEPRILAVAAEAESALAGLALQAHFSGR